mmetsp:Transcript_4714/g.11187  ORF Transcript_4714/g.11187 Transcript_4714/m.11187 type:complete len:491 (+) Transcript_4714:115-1587(+)|eukprot:CAMPEP_0206456332 /NCGR_PEP_ID=MMETSP0324_2-20121206/22302_1 /ASSEMBLY_ACC=CAM_ASM_000836 /TAXON_ID=2866 /ORGANISM="Crypthecodinium cohnii, Strain Seligo" /LENGTH=490 /DNA_ID=CAMNT_0053927241 /DNA_START=39 /DNA_END=1511 /DNA_ORIENTATION=-
MGRKQFGKNAKEVRRFRLVSRSQNDAHADSEDAGELVLEPFVKPGDAKRFGVPEEELAQIPEEWAAKHPEAFADPNAPLRKEGDYLDDEDEDEDEDPEAALEGDCYFPKDGYNYEQHLKRVAGGGGGGGSKAPGANGSAASRPVSGVGVVLAAPQLVDEAVFKKQQATTTEEEELLRALDHADEYEELDELEDLLPGGCLDATTVLWGAHAAEEADLPDLAMFKQMHAARMAAMAGNADLEGDDLEGAMGEGSGGSGTAPRAQQGALAAEFEDFFAAEYGEEDDIGGCSDDEIEGEVELDDSVLDEYLNDKQAEMDEFRSILEPKTGKYDNIPRVLDETKAIIEKHYLDNVEEGAGSDTSLGDDSEDESRNWDCETVLSTLSNVSNRPGKIGKLKLIKKPEVMKAVKEENEEESASSEEEAVELPDVITERKKGETPEEKRARKAGVKAMRKICRQMKKESKMTYKEEAAKMQDKTQTGDIRSKARTFRL